MLFEIRKPVHFSRTKWTSNKQQQSSLDTREGEIPVDLVNPVFWIILCVLGLAYVLALALRN